MDFECPFNLHHRNLGPRHSIGIVDVELAIGDAHLLGIGLDLEDLVPCVLPRIAREEPDEESARLDVRSFCKRAFGDHVSQLTGSAKNDAAMKSESLFDGVLDPLG